jgi:hypothetical protein
MTRDDEAAAINPSTSLSLFRRRLRPAAITAGVLAIAASLAAHGGFGFDQDRDDERHSHAYAIGLWGDMPYSDIQAAVGVPNLIADLNRHDLAFTVHDGDLKQGNGNPICDDALYANALDTFNTLRAPAMFTPGDNDWTDCDRPKNGGFSSLERLTHERQVFFNTPFSMGHHRIRQQVQTDSLCLGVVDAKTLATDLVPCLENRRWTVGGVTYATLNIQGTCNNRCGDFPDEKEYEARNHADIVWMQQTFEEARRRGSAAIMFISQADPGFGLIEIDGPTRDPMTLAETDANAKTDGFQEFLLALRDEVILFGRPVDYVHGDSHYFRIDKPLLDASGQRVENFTRVETFGDHAESGNKDVNWLEVFVDAASRGVFAYQPQIVPANQIAAP